MLQPRLMIAGAHSGAGKTTVSLAVMAALARRGFAVQPFKVGPDYIDPAFHEAATGRISRNLDSWLLPESSLTRLFARHAPAQKQDARQGETPGLSLIEGVMGLFDGQGTSSVGSSAHVATLLKAPVVLLINAEGVALSAAALVSGYAHFQADPASPRIGGVLLNKVSGKAHYALLRQCIEERTGIPCLGWLPKNAFPSLPGRHLGLLPPQEQEAFGNYLRVLADAAEQTLDLDALVALARSAPPLVAGDAVEAPRPSSPPHSPVRPVRIGVARDAAFSFYYQDNLDLLEALGAELVPFSPLRDRRLPEDLDGLYLGGGFPEMFAETLEANRTLRAALAKALESGLPAYAEGGGMLYLCSSLRAAPQGSAAAQPYAMVGFFLEEAEMTTRLQPFGYVAVTLHGDTPLGPAGTRFRAHEFHYSRLLTPESPATETSPVLTAEKPDGRRWNGGLHKKNVLAIFPHLHFYACPQVAAHFVGVCRRYRTDYHSSGGFRAV